MENSKRCILIGAGELNVKNIPVQDTDYVIAVDGGLDYCNRLHIVPNLVTGDFDSVKNQEDIKLLQAGTGRTTPQVIWLPCEKDDTDMLFAMKEGLGRGYRSFLIYGAVGGRLDHTIANIQTLLFLKRRGADGVIIEENMEIRILQNEKISFGQEKRGMLSLFSLEPKSTGVNITGMKYPLTDAVVTYDFPIGISNEYQGEAASVWVENGTLLLICQSGLS